MIPRFFPFLPILTLALACTGGGDDDGSGEPDAAAVSDAGSQTEADAMLPVPLPDAAPAGTVCQMKEPITQVGHFCNFEWSQCSSGSAYAIDCRPENVAGMAFSVCDCLQNGSDTGDILSSTVCSKGSWQEVEEIVNDQCGWDLL